MGVEPPMTYPYAHPYKEVIEVDILNEDEPRMFCPMCGTQVITEIGDLRQFCPDCMWESIITV